MGKPHGEVPRMELAAGMNLEQLPMEVHMASGSPVACARDSQALCEK